MIFGGECLFVLCFLTIISKLNILPQILHGYFDKWGFFAGMFLCIITLPVVKETSQYKHL